MNASSSLKNVGRALGLDFLRDEISAASKLLGLRARFGVDVRLVRGASPVSRRPIDLVIPVVDKDAGTLPLVIDSARRNIRHPVERIYLVCPGDSAEVRRIGREKGCEIVDERDLVPIRPKDIRYVWQGHDRASWVYQQFLKWSGGKFCTCRRYLVMDSDTAFVRPQVFEDDGRILFDFCDSLHAPYFEAFERIFGLVPRSPVAFTSHHALIDVDIVAEIVAEIERRHSKPWYEAIVDAIDQSEMSSVSDYDNYALYVFEKKPEEMRVRYWYNKSLPGARMADIADLERDYGRRYSTVSFHSYMRG